MAAELQPITAEFYADRILAGWEAYIIAEERSAPSRRPYTYASSYEACTRKLVLLITDGDKVPPFPPEVLAKFHRGKDRERNMKIDLNLVGRMSEPRFELVGEQERFELRDHKGRVAITGKVDFQLDFGRGKPIAPVECKDWDTNVTARINTFDDVMRGEWTRKGGYQLLCYLYGANREFGFLLLPRPGLPKLIPVSLYDHLDLVEEFLQKAEQALDHKEAGTLPDYIQDAGECRRCAFYGSVCNPPIASLAAQVLTDPELESSLERRESLKSAADEYGDLDTDIKKRLRGVESGVAGHFILEGKWQKQTTFAIPEKIKAEYAKTDPKGKFILQITRM